MERRISVIQSTITITFFWVWWMIYYFYGGGNKMEEQTLQFWIATGSAILAAVIVIIQQFVGFKKDAKRFDSIDKDNERINNNINKTESRVETSKKELSSEHADLKKEIIYCQNSAKDSIKADVKEVFLIANEMKIRQEEKEKQVQNLKGRESEIEHSISVLKNFSDLMKAYSEENKKLRQELEKEKQVSKELKQQLEQELSKNRKHQIERNLEKQHTIDDDFEPEL